MKFNAQATFDGVQMVFWLCRGGVPGLFTARYYRLVL